MFPLNVSYNWMITGDLTRVNILLSLVEGIRGRCADEEDEEVDKWSAGDRSHILRSDTD